MRALRFCPDPAGLVLQACAVLSNLGASSRTVCAIADGRRGPDCGGARCGARHGRRVYDPPRQQRRGAGASLSRAAESGRPEWCAVTRLSVLLDPRHGGGVLMLMPGENQAALIEAGGAVAVVRAMFQHWASPGVIEQALRVLREVTKSGVSANISPCVCLLLRVLAT